MTPSGKIITALRGNWLWFVLLGVALILVGDVVLGSEVIASLATAIAIGALMLISGFTETIGVFWCKGWSGFFFLLSGLLPIIVGVLFLRAPLGALLALLLACFLLVSGLFRIIAALSYRFAAWNWSLVSGIIDVILGIMIWQQWPASALWVLGLFLGISLVFRGCNWISLGLALRTLPRRATA